MSDDTVPTNDTQLDNRIDNLKKKQNARKAETIICEKCGFTYKRSNKTNHLRTKKHKESISIDKLKVDLQSLVQNL